MENVFCSQLVSKNQSLYGNALANSLPRNGPHVIMLKGILKETIEAMDWIHIPEDSDQQCCKHGISTLSE
jgi:hypothetical protein